MFAYTNGTFNDGSTIVDANNTYSSTKMGTSCVTSVLGLFSYGNNSVSAARADGGIKHISSIDYTIRNTLGVIGHYCTVVHGE